MSWTSRSSGPTHPRTKDASSAPIRPSRLSWLRSCACGAFPTSTVPNAYLPKFRQDFNRRFSVAPHSNLDTHRPLLKTENPDIILTHQKTAMLSKNPNAQTNKAIYQIQSDRPDYALRRAQVTVCENAKGKVTIPYKNQPLAYTIYHKPSCQAEVVDTKTPDHQIKSPEPSALNHPW